MLKATQLTFIIDITFNGKKAFDISNSAIIPTTIIKKLQLCDTNMKNRNKKKKNN